jgi:Xaa-Pro aminopeptidase
LRDNKGMTNLTLPYALYAKRRAALAAQINAQGGGIAIIPTALEQQRNRDNDFPFRADSYHAYFSGFTEPQALVVIVASPGGSHGALGTYKSVLFCRSKNIEHEIWDGFRYGPEGAREAFGFDEAFSIDDLDTKLVELMSNQPAVWWPWGSLAIHRGFESRIEGWLNGVRAKSRQNITAPRTQRDLCPLMDEMRLFKDASEIDTMRRAAQISAAAHARAMRVSAKGMRAKQGLREYHLEAELLHEFRFHGSQFPAYGSIVATGANACVLHYAAGNVELKDGDLCLIDAGCELDGYASDITRTFPVNGKFTGPQKTLYELVLDAQLKAIEATQPGKRFIDPHNAALRVLVQGMLDTALLDKNKVGTDIDGVIAAGAHSAFYMHRTGHWLGMDVHDCGDYTEQGEPVGADGKPASRILRAGMVTTVEPGIYVRPAEGVPEHFWNIGIRIEDDVVITDKGNEVISKDAPKTVADIEALMKD